MKIIELEKGKYVKVDGDRAEVIDLEKEIERTRYNLEACRTNLEEANKQLVSTKGLAGDVLRVVEAHNQAQGISQIEQEIKKFEDELTHLEGL